MRVACQNGCGERREGNGLRGLAEAWKKRNQRFRRPAGIPKSPPRRRELEVRIALPDGFTTFWSMSSPWRNALLALGAILLVGALTAEFWAQALATAVINQVVIPLTRLIVHILT